MDPYLNLSIHSDQLNILLLLCRKSGSYTCKSIPAKDCEKEGRKMTDEDFISGLEWRNMVPLLLEILITIFGGEPNKNSFKFMKLIPEKDKLTCQLQFMIAFIIR